MNKILSFCLFFSFVALLQAQNYEITFTASGASDVVETVYVENITQDFNVIISDNDTLIAALPESIGEYTFEDCGLRLFPNPVSDVATFEFYCNENVEIKIQLYSLTGQSIIKEFFKSDEKGMQSFILNGLQTGTYLLDILTEHEHYSKRIIAFGENTLQPQIQYDRVSNKAKPLKILKHAKGSTVIPYNYGDILLLKGVSGIYSTVVTIVPTENAVVNFEFVPCTDADGNNYPVVKIGEQTWMAENLAATFFEDGNEIGNITDNLNWSNMTGSGYCWYMNNYNDYGLKYGALYNWYVLNQGNPCPLGWHVSTSAEWLELIEFLGGDTIAGGKLKKTGALEWISPNIASNESGFSALPAGQRDKFSGVFDSESYLAEFWSLTSFDEGTAWMSLLTNSEKGITHIHSYKGYGASIRCVLGESNVIPVVTTKQVTDITSQTAQSGGIIVSSGGTQIIAKGVCWSTSESPTLPVAAYTQDGLGINEFQSQLNGLIPSTTYYIRAYATNAAGTGYGNQISFSTEPEGDFYIGQNYGGGIIFYIDGTGQHGLIASTTDQTPASWGCEGLTIAGAINVEIGTGQQNTTAILTECNDITDIAARICDNLVLNGYGDWYLPSKNELAQMYINKNFIGSFSNNYWSSSDYNNGGQAAYFMSFSTGWALPSPKNTVNNVRAIRSF